MSIRSMEQPKTISMNMHQTLETWLILMIGGEGCLEMMSPKDLKRISEKTSLNIKIIYPSYVL